MNRNKSIGISSRRQNQRSGAQREMSQREDNFGMMRMSDFDNFDRMFEDFSMPRGFGNIDRFFGGFGSGFSQFDDMRNEMFSNFDSITRGNNQGTVITKSYVSKVKYGEGGQPQKETYQTQSIRQTDKDGKSIQEKQQAYQNTKTGVQKAAHERLLNDKGVKVVKARNRNTGEDYEHNLYKGINEDDLGNFNNEYQEYRNKVKFDDNYKYLNNAGSRRSLPQNNNRVGNSGNSSQTRALPEDYRSRR